MPDVSNTTAVITLIFSFASCFMDYDVYSASDFFNTSLMAERTAITMRRATSQLIGALLSDILEILRVFGADSRQMVKTIVTDVYNIM